MSKSVNLKEYIHDKMDILFVALNAPEISNANQHWFSRNLSFWNQLCEAGIITQPIWNPLEGDERVFGSNQINFNNWNIGVTDLNREVVETDSSEVKTNKEQVDRILMILKTRKVKKLCLMHGKVAEEFEKHGLITRNYSGGANIYGKVGRFEATDIYEVPFHNASIPNKHFYYRLLFSEKPNTTVIKDIAKEKPVIQDASVPFKPKPGGATFILPDTGNSITDKDIAKGTLRITAGFKSHFPSRDSMIELVINGVTYIAKLVKRDSRSDLLKLGKHLIQQLGVKANGRLKFTKTGLNSFIIEKI